MTNDITTSSAPTLAETDAKFIQGVFLIKDAVLEYAKVHGLNARQIGERVRELGADAGDSTIARWLKGFRTQGLLEEKAQSQSPEAVRQRKHRDSVTNSQNEKMSQETPEPVTTLEPISPDVPLNVIYDEDLESERGFVPAHERFAQFSTNTEHSIEFARSRLNEDLDFDDEGLSREQVNDMLADCLARINAMTFQINWNENFMSQDLKEFGSYNSENLWRRKKSFTIIKSLLSDLTQNEKDQLLDLIQPNTTIDV